VQPAFFDTQCGGGYKYAGYRKGANAYTGIQGDIGAQADGGVADTRFYRHLAGWMGVAHFNSSNQADSWIQAGIIENTNNPTTWYLYYESNANPGGTYFAAVAAGSSHHVWIHRSSTSSTTWYAQVDGVDRWSATVPQATRWT
jgi:hypothetical protein